MPLRTVHVPKEMEPLFAQAEQAVARYFADLEADPARGTIEIVGERYVLVRAAALSIEFFALVEGLFGDERRDEAQQFARNILYDLAHAIGKSDARLFQETMDLHEPLRLVASYLGLLERRCRGAPDAKAHELIGEADDAVRVAVLAGVLTAAIAGVARGAGDGRAVNSMGAGLSLVDPAGGVVVFGWVSPSGRARRTLAVAPGGVPQLTLWATCCAALYEG